MTPVSYARIEPLGVVLEVQDGETLIEAAWRHGYYWPTVCQGNAECGLCYIEVDEGTTNLAPSSTEEQEALQDVFGRTEGASEALGAATPRTARPAHRLDRLRLACRARLVGDIVVTKRGVRPKPAP